MVFRRLQRSLAIIGFGLTIGGCTTTATTDSSDPLTGTDWQLVQIMSMDDSVYTPDNPARYTLSFQPEGQLQVQADCNRGQGSWTFTPPSKLEFGPLALTRMLCPPQSLSDRLVGNFEYVRSFVIENGHLFLATMADGAILEFEPLMP